VTLEFTVDGVSRLAQIAFTINERTENIGARRLHTVMGKVLEDISYEATSQNAQRVLIDSAYVEQRLAGLANNDDLARYVL
jgi:ATP-dependent HslUV protease ATP-binding subunit HslU